MKDNKYMSKEYTNCLRGIFAILVVIHHLYQYSGLLHGTYIGKILQLCGFLSVAMFFFFSGYGLMFSSNKKNYIEQFFRKRFLPLYCFYVVLIILYSFWTLLLETAISPRKIVQSFFFGETIVTNGWYLQATFIVYLLYLFCFKIFKTNKARILSIGVAIFSYCVFCYLIDLGINWYQTVPCIVLGMVYCYKKNWIDTILGKRVWTIFVLSLMSFVVCVMLSELSRIDVVFDVLYSIFFVCATITLSYILYNTSIINNKLFALCGNYSLEIYVAHGFFLRLIQLKYIENKLMYILTVIICTIITSVVMKIIYAKIVSLFEKHEQHKIC